MAALCYKELRRYLLSRSDHGRFCGSSDFGRNGYCARSSRYMDCKWCRAENVGGLELLLLAARKSQG